MLSRRNLSRWTWAYPVPLCEAWADIQVDHLGRVLAAERPRGPATEVVLGPAELGLGALPTLPERHGGSRRAVRETEIPRYLGGFRNPTEAVAMVGGWRLVGARLREVCRALLSLAADQIYWR